MSYERDNNLIYIELNVYIVIRKSLFKIRRIRKQHHKKGLEVYISHAER